MNDEGGEGVFGRKLFFCPKLQTFETDWLIQTCEDCNCFYVFCCSCQMEFDNDGRRSDGSVCHHYRLLFTDGACRQNGQFGATAGIGIACGEETDWADWQKSIPITASLDSGYKRTSQRAELLAALAGLRFMAETDERYYDSGENEHVSKRNKGKRKTAIKHQAQAGGKTWIIATDSEYVVKGITEWLPAWKVSKAFGGVFIRQMVDLNVSDVQLMIPAG